MPTVLHTCQKMPEGLLESLDKHHGWDLKEMPLNTDAGHEFCPYCKAPTGSMKVASAKYARMLAERVDLK